MIYNNSKHIGMIKEIVGKKISLFLLSVYKSIKKVLKKFIISHLFSIFSLKKVLISKIFSNIILTFFFLITINQIIFLIFYKFPLLYFFIPYFLKYFYIITSYNPLVYFIGINEITRIQETLILYIFKKISEIVEVHFLLSIFILNISILSLKILLIYFYSKFFLIDLLIPFTFLNEDFVNYLLENRKNSLHFYSNFSFLTIQTNSFFKIIIKNIYKYISLLFNFKNNTLTQKYSNKILNKLNFSLENFRLLNLLIVIDYFFSIYLCYICLYLYIYSLKRKYFPVSLFF